MAKKEETFIMVSLKESKAKKLAQVISSETCRKILDFLAKKKATETELAKELDIPISTVHYNLRHLLASKLVEADEFHYSEKGKEVNHYSLANKYVIITPKEPSESFREKLKSLIPAISVIGLATLAISFFSRTTRLTFGKTTGVIRAPMAEEAAMEAADFAVQAAPEAANAVSQATAQMPVEIYFLLGAISLLITYVLIAYIREKIKK
ncbi:helix-turn-helix domain-containing protein [Candidatus Woesearchaeota archaeon]|nr:helix-turn-helix domain-containing protein [Candidatus Woesearchaeota archaeon]